jgi:hypothetical protein
MLEKKIDTKVFPDVILPFSNHILFAIQVTARNLYLWGATLYDLYDVITGVMMSSPTWTVDGGWCASSTRIVCSQHFIREITTIGTTLAN